MRVTVKMLESINEAMSVGASDKPYSAYNIYVQFAYRTPTLPQATLS